MPVVVLTHEPPRDWSYPGSEDFHFVTEGIAAAIEKAREIAGDHDIGVTAGTIAGQALDAGLLDEVAIDLVPVVMGSGRRFFGDVCVRPAARRPDGVVRGRRVDAPPLPVVERRPVELAVRSTEPGGHASEVDPLRRAALEVLALPDRGALLDAVDEQRARGERLGAVRGGDGCHERDIPDGERADAVRGGDPKAGLARDLGTASRGGTARPRGAPRSRAR